ncbi:MAG: hypothetical protein WBC91_03350 [Phototrophicaceae bacterium]
MTLPINNLTLKNELRAFRPPIIPPKVPVRETPSTSFADLVRMLAESIADAQASLDRTSAELVKEFAETTVEVIPNMTQTIHPDGSVSYETAEPQEVSLLSLGVRPTFYQFSEATVEVVMDIEVVETQTEDGKRLMNLFAQTYNVKYERKLNRDVKTSSKLTAKLVPVPMPVGLEPQTITLASEGATDGG